MHLPGLGQRRRQSLRDHGAEFVDALWAAQPAAVYAPDRTLVDANPMFLEVCGYALAEIRGKSHDVFVDAATRDSADYKALWDAVLKGEPRTGEYPRQSKGGEETFLHASYIPVRDRRGRVISVVQVAFNITRQLRWRFDAIGRLAAIDKAQAIAEFDLDGRVLTANENFCRAVGYGLDEIKGRHHRMFLDPAEAAGADYARFWDELRAGRGNSGEYRRIGKGGREVRMQASYTPILDVHGKPYKIVKYATDATDATARKQAVTVLGEQLSRLAEGDLTASIDETFAGDIEKVRLAFNATVARMRDIVGRLRAASSTLKIATNEILSGANDLADRTGKQAAAVEETSAALEQLSATVSDNAERAASASSKARAVSQIAAETNGVMKQANDAMERISTSSTKISNIIGLIDDIAFQTNLLALNASVEAARAGDAGKGFAVVAVEVRRLAQSAAGASAEVKALIEQSSTEVATGSRRVAEATGKVTSMLEGIHDNSVLIEEITTATSEQSTAIDELTSSVKQVDEMTQHNAALVQQTNASIERTEGQAIELDRIVDVFVLGEAPAARPKAPAARAAARPRPAMPNRVARSYGPQGNTALKDDDWNEF
ncbi:MAG TPA: methyl-accepting chemotaxis protein [Devosia sp.]|nr:methyl-accepting chemotaxis protein [Devosia sp.]